MNVKKSVLEKKSNRELEEYIQSESRFTPQAINYAFEILKSRGKEFSEEEIEIINSQINRTIECDTIVLHPNEIKSSNLILISAGLGFLYMFLSPKVFTSFSTILTGIITIVIIIAIGIGIRNGIQWIKYVMATLVVLGFSSFPIIVQIINSNLIAGIVNITQSVLQIIAVILLFISREEK
ncbi:MAG TPA: hypothetical protein VF465_20535 [Flavobacterium sp.]|uniref:hypothetical protein n=1 Tax=Flavobacterium sp. TaxID=239 RepID=UPI002ED08654